MTMERNTTSNELLYVSYNQWKRRSQNVFIIQSLGYLKFLILTFEGKEKKTDTYRKECIKILYTVLY